MFHKRFISIVFLFFLVAFTFAQEKEEIEKLKIEISRCAEDSIKVKKIIKLGTLYHNKDYIAAIKYYKSAVNLAVKLKYVKGQINAYNSMGDENWYQANYDKAFENYYKAYRISDSIKDKKKVALSLYNLGWIACIQQHNYKEDPFLYRSLQIYRKLNDLGGLLRIYNALGSYYTERYNDSREKNYFDSAVYYTNQGIDLGKKTKNFRNIGAFYVNLGDLFYSAKDFESTKFYLLKAAEIYKNKNDSDNFVFCNGRIARCDVQNGDINEAIKTLLFTVAYCKRKDNKELERESLLILANANYKIGKFKEAFDFYNIYTAKKAEIDKKSFATSLVNLENNYNLEKSEANVSQLTQQNEIEELKNKKKSYFIFVLIVIGVVVIVIAFLLFRQNKLKQLTNLQLKEQNQIIFEKKQEIDHSIQYAKGIQLAVLPDLAELNVQFPESFVYYKPKDVVSGDFYWFGKLENEFYCLAADCTGHGVPGALLSIIGMDKVVQAIFEKEIKAPNKILSYLNVQIKNVLKQHSDASIQKDGMDIALLKFNKQINEVDYSAANRPLYLVREGKLIEFKADKTAIAGFTPNEQEFKSNLISLQKNDCLFITTDGYADQFGGPEGKKMMTKKLKDILISVSSLSSSEQKKRIEADFDKWKGLNEQVDDVLVIGIKI